MASKPSTRGLGMHTQNLKPGTRAQSSKGVLGLRNIQNENNSRPPLTRKDATSNLLKDTTNKVFGLKRKAETSNDENRVAKKRSAFGDITNAIEKNIKDGKKVLSQKDRALRSVSNTLKTKVSKPAVVKGKTRSGTFAPIKKKGPVIKKDGSKDEEADHMSFCESLPASSQDTIASSQESNRSNVAGSKSDLDTNKTDLDDSSAYVTASEGRYILKSAPDKHKVLARCSPPIPQRVAIVKPRPRLPEGVDDYDREMESDLHAVSSYAQDIFTYYKKRENDFQIKKYIDTQPDVSKSMRSILVDWMVEVQESFELNHETLYLAVKIIDLYLSKTVIKRDQLQLLGSTSMFIACKFDERTPPYADDFLYICDDAYKRKELIAMEIEILKVIGFDLGVPLSYRFLRRYARCAKVSMEDLTLSRYILEMSLMDYELIDASDSAMAAAALFLTRIIRSQPTWTPTLKYYSGYDVEDIYHLVHHLHNMISQTPKEHLKTIRNKYSHRVFYEVAKIPIPEVLDI